MLHPRIPLLLPLLSAGLLAGCSGKEDSGTPSPPGPAADSSPSGDSASPGEDSQDQEQDSGTLQDSGAPLPDSGPVYMTFSGGGFHTHSAMAGWFMGMMDASGMDLEGLTQNVDAVAANSGGSWFLGHLAFSEAFRQGLEETPDQYSTEGYLGQLRKNFDLSDPCGGLSTTMSTICEILDSLKPLFPLVRMTDAESISWSEVVREVIYAPLDMSRELGSVTLDSSPRQSWAEDKALLIAAALLTDEVMLTLDSEARDSYGVQLADKSRETPVNFTPVTFSGMGSSGHSSPSIFRSPEMTITYYSEGWVFDWDPAITTTDFSNPRGVGVIDATAASSAAAGALASMQVVDEADLYTSLVLSTGTISYSLSGLAPSANLSGEQISFPGDISSLERDDFIEDQSVRLVDGAYLDNTAAANLVAHLQANGLGEDFEILLFLNDIDPSAELGNQVVFSSLAELFGYTPAVNGVVESCLADYCLRTMSAQIFDPSPWEDASEVWSFTERGVSMRYFDLEVSTVANSSFGVEAGHQGRLHVFTLGHEESELLPSLTSTFGIYGDIIEVARSGISEHGGWEHLERALGLARE